MKKFYDRRAVLFMYLPNTLLISSKHSFKIMKNENDYTTHYNIMDANNETNKHVFF